jgi:Mg2+-importing ATPase
MPDPLQPPVDYWSRPAQQLLGELGTTPQGLGDDEARVRLKTFGPNVLKVRERATALGLFLKQFKSPLILILLFATGITRTPWSSW